MKAHLLAAMLLAGPDHEVVIDFDEQSRDECPEAILEGTATGIPTSIDVVEGHTVRNVTVTITALDLLDGYAEPDGRTPLEAFQEDNEDQILDDIRTGVRDPSGRLIRED